jgi:hypothetical protein
VVEVDAVLSLYAGSGIPEGLSWKTLFTTQLVGILLDEKLMGGGPLCHYCCCCFGTLLFRESVGNLGFALRFTRDSRPLMNSRCYARTQRVVSIERN